MVKKGILFFLTLFVIACSTSHSFFKPEETDVAKVNVTGKKVTLDELTDGYHLYVSTCSGCHTLYRPSHKNKAEWEKLLPEMFSKTQLNYDQQKLIKQYIFSKL